MNLIADKSNSIGVVASTLCLVHCLATPFIFIAAVCSDSCCEATPVWWKWIDFLFLGIAFFAVYHSARITSNKMVAKGLWLSWVALLLVIVSEQAQLFPVSEYAIYVPALSLIVLHLYNRKFCKCEEDKCCTSNT